MNDGTVSAAALLKWHCWGRLPSAKSFEWGFDVQGSGCHTVELAITGHMGMEPAKGDRWR